MIDRTQLNVIKTGYTTKLTIKMIYFNKKICLKKMIKNDYSYKF